MPDVENSKTIVPSDTPPASTRCLTGLGRIDVAIQSLEGERRRASPWLLSRTEQVRMGASARASE
jgi:hypothetical protein